MALAAIAAMYAAFIAIGWRASRKGTGSADDFMVAGRAMPLWLATATMTATWVDAGYLLGTAEGVYRSSLASGLQGGVCFGIPSILDYPSWMPFKTVAAATGVVLLPLVSRLTASISPPLPLRRS
jgi:Na+/proline symporter